MPKGLVVPLDDETYRKLKAMSASEGKYLKDCAYDIIKNAVDKNREPESIAEILMQLNDSE